MRTAHLALAAAMLSQAGCDTAANGNAQNGARPAELHATRPVAQTVSAQTVSAQAASAPGVPAQPALIVVDFGGASATVGDLSRNAAELTRDAPGARGPIRVRVTLSDPPFPSEGNADGGYQWAATTHRAIDGVPCRWPIVAVRASASFGAETVPIAFDGYATDGVGFLPWELDDGDRPTLTVESVTFDAAPPPACF